MEKMKESVKVVKILSAKGDGSNPNPDLWYKNRIGTYVRIYAKIFTGYSIDDDKWYYAGHGKDIGLPQYDATSYYVYVGDCTPPEELNQGRRMIRVEEEKNIESKRMIRMGG